MMKMNKLGILGTIFFLLVMSLASAQSIDFDVPAIIQENVETEVNITISGAAFSGNIQFLATNAETDATSISFSDSEFSNDEYKTKVIITGSDEGSYSLYVALHDANNTLRDDRNRSGEVNSSGPNILEVHPSGVLSSNSAMLSVLTEEDASCRYDTADVSYESMTNGFTTTGETNSSKLLTDLSEGSYRYYVRCIDDEGHASLTSEVISFNIDNLVSARVELQDQSPVKEGIVEVEVITSKSILNAPLLEYSLNDAPNTKIKVSLTGSGTKWHGYLVITPDDDNKVGTFYFRGVDETGAVGTRITNDNLFIIDTTKPEAPISVKAVAASDGSIRLNWYYDGEEPDYYKIYRATTSGVHYVDEYGSANRSELFTDRSTLDKVTYYYRVSAIDLAGNEGPLSQEVFATSLNKNSPSQNNQQQEEEIDDTPKVLPPDLVPKVDAAVKEIEKILLDVKDTQNDLDSENIDQKELLTKFGVTKAVSQSKTALDDLKSQLEGFKEKYATESELDSKIDTVLDKAAQIQRTTPRSAEIIEQTEFTQATAKEDIKIASQEMLKNLGVSDEELDQYIKLNTRIRDDFIVETEAQVIQITFFDDSTKEQTFITKNIAYKDAVPLEDINVVEIIPKKIAANVNEISFKNEKYEVLNEDPVVKFGYLEFDYTGEEISYSVDKRIDLEEVKNSKTVGLLSMAELANEGGLITGFSIFPAASLGLGTAGTIMVWLGIVTILGLSAYYFLFVKNYKDIFKSGLSISRMRTHFESRRLGNQFNRHANTYPEYTPPVQKMQTSVAGSRGASEMLQNIHQEVRSAKADLADRLHPVFMDLHDKVEPKREVMTNAVSTSDIASLIQQAHIHVANNQKAKAAKLYPQISLLYQQLPKEMKSQYHVECVNLHKMLSKK